MTEYEKQLARVNGQLDAYNNRLGRIERILAQQSQEARDVTRADSLEESMPKTYKRRVEELHRDQAHDLIKSVRAILWPRDNVNVEWSSDQIADVASVLERYGLDPTDEARAADEPD